MTRKQATKVTIGQVLIVKGQPESAHGLGHSIPLGSKVKVEHTGPSTGLRINICVTYRNYTQTMGHKAFELT